MKSLRTILILMFLIDLLGLGGLWYGYTVMQSEKSKEIELRKELLVQEQEGKLTSAQKRMLTSTKLDRELLSQFIFEPSDEDQIDFISRIERLGTSTTKATVETVSLEIGKTNILSGEFSIKGTWPQVYHTLRLLEEFPARVVITRFDAREAGSGMWTSSVKLDLLSMKGATIAPPPAPPAKPR